MAALVATISFFSWFDSAAADGQRIVVEIKSFKYRPKTPEVKAGDVIVWVNKDVVPHTVTAKDDSWNSGLIKSGGSWETVVGDDTFHDYFCKFHPSMIGGLEVSAK